MVFPQKFNFNHQEIRNFQKKIGKWGKKLPKVEIYIEIRNSTILESKYVLPLHCSLISLASGV